MRQYSPFFQTLHDEEGPVGYLGRGTHYSVLRCVAWHDDLLAPLGQAAFHDFAVIWDEDHDERIIQAIERIYFRGLLTPALFVGERKGTFSLITKDECAETMKPSALEKFCSSVDEVAQPGDDAWSTAVQRIDDPHINIIADTDERVRLYLRNIKELWRLGSRNTHTT